MRRNEFDDSVGLECAELEFDNGWTSAFLIRSSIIKWKLAPKRESYNSLGNVSLSNTYSLSSREVETVVQVTLTNYDAEHMRFRMHRRAFLGKALAGTGLAEKGDKLRDEWHKNIIAKM